MVFLWRQHRIQSCVCCRKCFLFACQVTFSCALPVLRIKKQWITVFVLPSPLYHVFSLEFSFMFLFGFVCFCGGTTRIAVWRVKVCCKLTHGHSYIFLLFFFFSSFNYSWVPVVFLTALRVLSCWFQKSFHSDSNFFFKFNNGSSAHHYVCTVRIVFPSVHILHLSQCHLSLSLYCSIIPLRFLVTVYIQGYFILNNSLTLAYIVILLFRLLFKIRVGSYC